MVGLSLKNTKNRKKNTSSNVNNSNKNNPEDPDDELDKRFNTGGKTSLYSKQRLFAHEMINL